MKEYELTLEQKAQIGMLGHARDNAIEALAQTQLLQYLEAHDLLCHEQYDKEGKLTIETNYNCPACELLKTFGLLPH